MAEKEFPACLPYLDDATVVGARYVWKRPHLEDFLNYCFETYTVAVWSSARRYNVDLLCNFLFTPEQRQQLLFKWDQSNCVKVEPNPDPQEANKPLFEKHLSHVWEAFPQYSAKSTVIVDDSPLKMRHNPNGCVVIANPWKAWERRDKDLLIPNGRLFREIKWQ